MKYAIIAIFLLSGREYVEQRNIDLNQCPSRIAMLRLSTKEVVAKIEGGVKYVCRPMNALVMK